MSADADSPGQSDWLRVLSVRVGDAWCAVESDRIDGVVAQEEVTPVPNTADSVGGVARLRGETTVVVDLHALLGHDHPAASEERILVFQRGTDETPVGLAIDEVGGIETHAVSDIRSASEAGVDPETFSVVIEGDTRTLPVFGIERIARGAVTAEADA